MTHHEQVMFNEKIERLHALEWRDRTIRRLMNKLEPLGANEKIALLRKVDELIG